MILYISVCLSRSCVTKTHLSFEALVPLNIANLLGAISSLAALPSAFLLQLARCFRPCGTNSASFSALCSVSWNGRTLKITPTYPIPDINMEGFCHVDFLRKTDETRTDLNPWTMDRLLCCALPFDHPKNWLKKWMYGQGRCVQGNHTKHTHTGNLAYAFDFKLKPGTKVLAARDGIVAAFCDHFSEGGLRESLLPRANFVALRHLDSTYTRYVHLMHGGVLVRLGQKVRAGEAIALSGNTGFTAGPHLHFDAVDILPQETSELRILHPEVLTIPSVAAIFSGPLGIREAATTAPLVYLSPAALASGPSASSAYASEPSPDPGYPRERRLPLLRPRADALSAAAEACASQFPLLPTNPEVVVLIDRGGLNGKQTFADAVAAAADAVASVLIPAASEDGLGGRGPPRCCRCVAVIVANDRAGHELFSMAPPKNGQSVRAGWRAPFPVAMVSQESGRLLKGALSAAAATAAASTPEAALLRRGEKWGTRPGAHGGAAGGTGYGWPAGGELPMLPTVARGENGTGGVFVCLGAAEPCLSFNSGMSRASSASFGEQESACGYSSAEEEGGQEDASGESALGRGGGEWCTALEHAGKGEFEGRGLANPVMGAYSEWSHRYGSWQRETEAEEEGGFETGEWKRELMLYDAKTLPVRFERPYSS